MLCYNKSEKENLSDLGEAQDQIQQTFNTLLYRTTNLQSRAKSIQQFVVRFKRTNKDYVKVKEVAEDHIRSILTEEGIMKLLSAALNAVVEALRQDPNACANLVFADNNNENNGGMAPNTNTNANASTNTNTDEYRNGILMLAKNLFNAFVTQGTDHTLNKLESESTEEESNME